MRIGSTASIAACRPKGFPAYTVLPFPKRITLCSFMKTAEQGWCMLQITVAPCFARTWSTSITTPAARLSSPEVGSSSTSMSGDRSSSTAMETLRRSPFEIPRPPDQPLAPPPIRVCYRVRFRVGVRVVSPIKVSVQRSSWSSCKTPQTALSTSSCMPCRVVQKQRYSYTVLSGGK